uniref:C2H2-type domain-containing protein n=1 Tax=Kalanchoe fedtschenkoi TaxID=63787 RepID=A0A7N0UBP2_KALFE
MLVPAEMEHVPNLAAPEEEDNDEIDDDVEEQGWDDWRAGSDGGAEDEEGDPEPDMLCLLCDSVFTSRDDIFGHCAGAHRFDFSELRKKLGLDFYACFKLLNYIRIQVAERKCWICNLSFPSSQELQAHLHPTVDFNRSNLPWEDDKYLSPFIQDDPLLYIFGEDEDDVDYPNEEDREELIKDIELLKVDDIINELSIRNDNLKTCTVNGLTDRPSTSDGSFKPYNETAEDRDSKIPLSNAVTVQIKNANKSYFGGYSSFVIHREMISDKVRTDAYRDAILGNPCLFNGAILMDVGCGTGILSLFAVQAGASRVIAVEASEKMASVATQIAKDNALLWEKSPGLNSKGNGGIQVVQGMIEEINDFDGILPNSVDVLISEWMGYCLLYETMLNSVLFARDRWLKPGGAVLPDTATMFVAGFGKGATSIPFWDNVYGFNMSCVGTEVVEHASKNPIVDVVDSEDIVTNSVVLKAFDLATVTPEELDFTTSVALEPKSNDVTWCYGLVLWFDTNFTSRFCKEKQTVLSTSPFTQKTHWSQTILTFREPVALFSGEPSAKLMSDGVTPWAKMLARISIARAAQHRSIDISLEVTATSLDGRKHRLPAQLFTL